MTSTSSVLVSEKNSIKSSTGTFPNVTQLSTGSRTTSIGNALDSVAVASTSTTAAQQQPLITELSGLVTYMRAMGKFTSFMESDCMFSVKQNFNPDACFSSSDQFRNVQYERDESH